MNSTKMESDETSKVLGGKKRTVPGDRHKGRLRESHPCGSFRKERPEKAMAPYSSTLAWKIPWTEEPGRSDTTERLHFHFSFSCIGEGNGNPLQCSCLENPRDGGA